MSRTKTTSSERPAPQRKAAPQGVINLTVKLPHGVSVSAARRVLRASYGFTPEFIAQSAVTGVLEDAQLEAKAKTSTRRRATRA